MSEVAGFAAARALIADALGCAEDELPAEPRLGVPAAWDSIGHMRLVLTLEERLSRALTPEEIVGVESLGDVAALLAGAPKAA